MTTTPALGFLSPDEVTKAGRLLARAFAEDPIITHYLSDPIRREVALPAFFEGVLEELVPSGQVFTATVDGEFAGVAAWLPPDPIEPGAPARARAQAAHRQVEALFPRSFPTMMSGFAALESLHPAEPHWYLAFVGIEPALQGRSIGASLLNPVLRVADETSTSCYLETPFPRTHSFYERLGFVRSADRDVFEGAPQGVATFLRPSR